MESELPSILKAFAALLFVLGLMGGLALILRKLGLSGHVSVPGQKPRLKLVESIPLDNRRRLAIVGCDGKEHLVILGMNGETVVETDLPPKDNV